MFPGSAEFRPGIKGEIVYDPLDVEPSKSGEYFLNHRLGLRGLIVGCSRLNARDARSDQKHERHSQRRHLFQKQTLVSHSLFLFDIGLIRGEHRRAIGFDDDDDPQNYRRREKLLNFSRNFSIDSRQDGFIERLAGIADEHPEHGEISGIRC